MGFGVSPGRVWCCPSGFLGGRRAFLAATTSFPDPTPLPRIDPGVWYKGVEDDQGCGRRQAPRVESSGCHGLALHGQRRDHDEDGSQGGGRRSWKDTLLGRGRASIDKTPAADASSSRRRS